MCIRDSPSPEKQTVESLHDVRFCRPELRPCGLRRLDEDGSFRSAAGSLRKRDSIGDERRLIVPAGGSSGEGNETKIKNGSGRCKNGFFPIRQFVETGKIADTAAVRCGIADRSGDGDSATGALLFGGGKVSAASFCAPRGIAKAALLWLPETAGRRWTSSGIPVRAPSP